MENYQQEFIDNVRYHRRKRGLSQAGFAELCEVATGTIGNIECGIAKPSFELILKMAEVLHVHPALLFASDSFFQQTEIQNRDYDQLQKIFQELTQYFQCR